MLLSPQLLNERQHKYLKHSCKIVPAESKHIYIFHGVIVLNSLKCIPLLLLFYFLFFTLRCCCLQSFSSMLAQSFFYFYRHSSRQRSGRITVFVLSFFVRFFLFDSVLYVIGWGPCLHCHQLIQVRWMMMMMMIMLGCILCNIHHVYVLVL